MKESKTKVHPKSLAVIGGRSVVKAVEYDEDADLSTTSLKKKLKEEIATESRVNSVLAHLDETGVMDTAAYNFYKASLMDTLEMIPLAKANFMQYQSQSNAYSYNALVTKAQELLSDIEALSDRGRIFETIIDTQIRPAFMDLASNMANCYAQSLMELEASLSEMDLEPKLSKKIKTQTMRTFKGLLTNMGRYLQDRQDHLIARVRSNAEDD